MPGSRARQSGQDPSLGRSPRVACAPACGPPRRPLVPCASCSAVVTRAHAFPSGHPTPLHPSGRSSHGSLVELFPDTPSLPCFSDRAYSCHPWLSTTFNPHLDGDPAPESNHHPPVCLHGPDCHTLEDETGFLYLCVPGARRGTCTMSAAMYLFFR